MSDTARLFLNSPQTNFLTALYLVMGGSILYRDGLLLFERFDEGRVKDDNDLLYRLVEWVGALVSALFVVSLVNTD